MRIGIDVRELASHNISGIGRYLRNFLEFALNERPEHTFVVYGNQNSDIDFKASNLQIKIIRERNTLYWDNVILSREIARDRVDLFFSPYDKLPLFTTTPSIITVHDLLFNIAPVRGYERNFIYNVPYMFLRRIMARKAVQVITVSQHSKNDLIRMLRIPEKKVRVIPNGVSSSFQPVTSKELINKVKKRYLIKQDYILYVGNFKPHKNLPTLIEAFHQLPEELRARHQLVLGGKLDRHSPQLMDLAQRLGLEGKVLFTGMVSDTDLPVLYSGANIFVFPSLYEGFGLPPLESMSCGTPVVCSDRTSLPEVVGDSGILVDPAQPENFTKAMESILSDRELSDRLRAKGLKRARLFSLEKTMKLVLETIEEKVNE